MRPQPGDLINGKYRLIRLIGDGGMGSVFEARHEYLGTAVALKFLHPELSRRPGLVQRFLQEARVSASIKSIHVAHVTDVDQAGEGLAYLVMELLEGRSLQATIASQGKLSLDVALDYTMQMLAGLEAAHAIGVVHRDLKPDNVFVVTTPRGPLVKLLDFGIAKLRRSKEYQETGLTRPGVMMGTPEYMAPEQAYSADSVDARADVYSVGAILYEMLCGKRPAQGEDPQQIAAFILAHKVPRLSQVDGAVPDALAAVVHRAMAPMAADRFASVAALRNALNPFCGELSLIGRLAATPAPSGGVADTLPPEEPDTSVKPPVTLPGDRATPVQPAPIHAAQVAQVEALPPWALAPTSPAAGYGPAPPAGAFADSPSYARRGKPRGRVAIWVLLGTVALAGAAVAVVVATAEPVRRPPPETGTEPALEPAAAAPPTAARPATTTIAPPLQPAAGAAPPVSPRPATKPAARADAGAGGDASQPGPPIPGLPTTLPFPFPSVIPMPSFPVPLPPIPSGFPPISIPGLPGFPGVPAPAPASSP